MLFARLFFAAALTAQLQACTERADSFYPLGEGNWRLYRSETQILDDTKVQRVMVGVVGTTVADDKKAVIVRQAPFHDSFVMRTDQGIVRIARRDRYNNVVTWEPTPQIILPDELETGRSWRSTTELALVESRTFARQDRLRNRVIPLELTFNVAALTETVAVPAGSFDNCLLIIGTGTVQVRTDRGNALAEVKVEQRDWYAPGIGLIKSDRAEASESPFLKPGFYKLELLQSGG